MKYTPILYSGAMIRAILEGRKTQTRRLVKPQPERVQLHRHKGEVIYDGEQGMWCWNDLVLENIWDFPENEDRKALAARCPYGVPGDRLWAKETWMAWDRTSHEYDEWEPWSAERRGGLSFNEYRDAHGAPDAIEYAATSDSGGPWAPSIFLPRWASRITQDLLSVRLERLHDISEEDIRAEGVRRVTKDGKLFKYCVYDRGDYSSVPWMDMPRTGRECYLALWDSINGKRAPAASNPWVWVLGTKTVETATQVAA